MSAAEEIGLYNRISSAYRSSLEVDESGSDAIGRWKITGDPIWTPEVHRM